MFFIGTGVSARTTADEACVKESLGQFLILLILKVV